MRLINNILVLFLSAIFLMSATGLFLNFHSCQMCDISEVFFNSDENRHEHEGEMNSECCEDLVCEIEKRSESECCNDDVFYIKISEPFTYSVVKIKFEKTFQFVNLLFSFIPKTKIDQSTEFIKPEKPPNLSGLQLLLNICILRI